MVRIVGTRECDGGREVSLGSRPGLCPFGMRGRTLVRSQRLGRHVAVDAVDTSSELPVQRRGCPVVESERLETIGLAVVVGAISLDPSCDGRMATGAFRLGQRAVRDLSDELRGEGVLALVEGDEVTVGELAKETLGVALVTA